LRDHPVYLAKVVNVSAASITYQLPKNMKGFNRNMEKLILKLLINDATFCKCLLEGRKNLSDKQKVQNSQQQTVNDL
jgi:hypothetical protein